MEGIHGSIFVMNTVCILAFRNFHICFLPAHRQVCAVLTHLLWTRRVRMGVWLHLHTRVLVLFRCEHTYLYKLCVLGAHAHVRICFFARLLICSFIPAFLCSLIHSLVCLLAHSFISSFSHSLVRCSSLLRPFLRVWACAPILLFLLSF